MDEILSLINQATDLIRAGQYKAAIEPLQGALQITYQMTGGGEILIHQYRGPWRYPWWQVQTSDGHNTLPLRTEVSVVEYVNQMAALGYEMSAESMGLYNELLAKVLLEDDDNGSNTP